MTPGVLIEGLVVVLLVATICYCSVLSSRLKKLKSEESALRATIAELITATDLAERAIRGLKVTANEHQKTLGLRVKDAEKLNNDLTHRLEDGHHLMERLVAVIQAGAGEPEMPIEKSRELVIEKSAPERKNLPSQRRATQPRKAISTPHSVSELAAEATARINALRRSGS